MLTFNLCTLDSEPHNSVLVRGYKSWRGAVSWVPQHLPNRSFHWEMGARACAEQFAAFWLHYDCRYCSIGESDTKFIPHKIDLHFFAIDLQLWYDYHLIRHYDYKSLPLTMNFPQVTIEVTPTLVVIICSWRRPANGQNTTPSISQNSSTWMIPVWSCSIRLLENQRVPVSVLSCNRKWVVWFKILVCKKCNMWLTVHLVSPFTNIN